MYTYTYTIFTAVLGQNNSRAHIRHMFNSVSYLCYVTNNPEINNGYDTIHDALVRLAAIAKRRRFLD